MDLRRERYIVRFYERKSLKITYYYYITQIICHGCLLIPPTPRKKSLLSSTLLYWPYSLLVYDYTSIPLLIMMNASDRRKTAEKEEEEENQMLILINSKMPKDDTDAPSEWFVFCTVLTNFSEYDVRLKKKDEMKQKHTHKTQKSINRKRPCRGQISTTKFLVLFTHICSCLVHHWYMTIGDI